MNLFTNVCKGCFALVLLCLFVQPACARPELGPPSIQLRTNISNLALLKLVQKDDHSLSFVTVENLHNEAPAELTLKVNQTTSQSLNVGQAYVVGFIAYKTLKPSKAVIARPGGPVLMNLPGAEPAIFADQDALKTMLTWPIDETLNSPPDMLPLVLDGAFNDDPQTRSFFITELVTRPAFLTTSTAKTTVKKLLLDPTLSWQDKGFMVTFGGLDQLELQSDWFCQWSQNTLLYASTQFDAHGQQTGLIKALFNNRDNCSNTITTAAIARWIDSNHAGTVEAAIKALREVDLNLAQKRVATKRLDTHLSGSLRMILSNYLTRLNNEINQSKSTPQKED